MGISRMQHRPKLRLIPSAPTQRLHRWTSWENWRHPWHRREEISIAAWLLFILVMAILIALIPNAVAAAAL